MLYSLFFVLFSLLISLSTAFITLRYLSSQKEILFKRILEILTAKVNHVVPDLTGETKEMEEQVEDRLNEIIAAFKREIPMISVVLSQKKEEELKELAKVELIKILPAMKKRYLTSLNTVSNCAQDRFLESNFGSKFNEMCTKFWDEIKLKMFLRAAGTGLIFGLVGAVLYSYIIG